MSAPSPFDVSRAIGANTAGAFREVRDENAIERILSQASQSGNPRVLQDSMSKILSQVSPERQGPAMQYLQNLTANIQQKQEKARAEAQGRTAAEQAGYTYGAPPQVQAQQSRDNSKSGRLAQYGLGGGQPQGRVPSVGGTPVPSNVIQTNQPSVQDTSSSPFKNMSDDQLILATGAPDREVSEAAKAELKNRQEEKKRKKPGDEFASIREKSIADYVNTSIASGEEAENLRFSLDEVRKAIKGDISGPGVTALAKNNPYTQLLIGLTPDEATLQSANKKLLEGTKSIFGSKPTEREIFLLLNSMLPSIGKSYEANLAGLNFIERVNDLKLLHADTVSELTEGGTKYISDLERQVNAKMRPYAESLKKDLSVAVEALNESGKKIKAKGKSGQIKVKSPDGKVGYMSQENIDKAKANNVIFTPV